MINPKAEEFWINKGVKDLEQFKDVSENVKESTRDLWKSIISIHGTILGISISLMAYLKNDPNSLLLATWVIQIACITLGLLIFKLDIDREFKHGLNSVQFGMDMNEINERHARGEFLGKEAEREGLITASLMKFELSAQGTLGPHWTELAKKLYAEYEPKLPSSKYFTSLKETGLRKVHKVLKREHPRLVSVFYFLSLAAFILLLLSVVMNAPRSKGESFMPTTPILRAAR